MTNFSISNKAMMTKVANKLENVIKESLSIYSEPAQVETRRTDEWISIAVSNPEEMLLTMAEVSSIQEATQYYLTKYADCMYCVFDCKPYFLKSGDLIHIPTMEFTVRVRKA